MIFENKPAAVKLEIHPCEKLGCKYEVTYDDEPLCFLHSAYSRIDISGYSYKKLNQPKQITNQPTHITWVLGFCSRTIYMLYNEDPTNKGHKNDHQSYQGWPACSRLLPLPPRRRDERNACTAQDRRTQDPGHHRRLTYYQILRPNNPLTNMGSRFLFRRIYMGHNETLRKERQ